MPTTGATCTIAEVEAIRLNSNLGVITDFVNFPDLVSIVVSSGFDSGGFPVAAMLIAP